MPNSIKYILYPLPPPYIAINLSNLSCDNPKRYSYKLRRGRNMLQLNYKLTDEDYIEFNEFNKLIHSEIGKRNLFFF